MNHYEKLHKLLEQFKSQLQIPELRELYLRSLEPRTPISYPYAGIAHMIYDKGVIHLGVEDSDPFLWGCLRKHLTAEFAEFDKDFSNWKRNIATLVRRCHDITVTIANKVTRRGWDSAEPYLDPSSKDFGPGVFYDILILSVYQCVIANHPPHFQRVHGPHGLVTLVMDASSWSKGISRGQSTLLDQIERCCLHIACDDAIKKKVRQVLRLAKDLEDNQKAIRQRLRLVLDRGTFKGICPVCSDLVS